MPVGTILSQSVAEPDLDELDLTEFEDNVALDLDPTDDRSANLYTADRR